MKQNATHRHIRCGRYIYSVDYRHGKWICGGGEGELTPERAAQGYVKFLKSLRIGNSGSKYMLKNLAYKTIRELHEAEKRQKNSGFKKGGDII